MRTTLPRWLPLSGLVFVAVVLAAVLGLSGDTPTTDASGAEIAAYYDGEWRHFASVFVFAATALFLVLFAVALASRLAGDRFGPWELVLLGGALLAAGGILLSATAQFALLDAVDQELSAASLESVNALTGATWVFFNAGFGVMTLGLAGSLLAAGERRALGWVAVVLGVALFVPFADFVALLITLAWIAVVGVLLARRPGTVREAAVTTAS